jgi:alcohol-forming fatty acyl-CoA reductase
LLTEFFSFFLKNLSFDDMNLQRLRIAIEDNPTDAEAFCFDPKIIDWSNYFYRIHIPGVLKFLSK